MTLLLVSDLAFEMLMQPLEEPKWLLNLLK